MKQQKKRSKKRSKRPSRFDALTESIAQNYAHQHTMTITSRRRVLEFEGLEVDNAIATITAALLVHRRRRKEIDAAIRGLTNAVGKR